jgi:hypothetical protein
VAPRSPIEEEEEEEEERGVKILGNRKNVEHYGKNA